MSIVLRLISATAGEALRAGTKPPDVQVAADYPTEFSVSCWGRGYATAAVRALVKRAEAMPGVERIVAHTPLDRPASGRVLEKPALSLSERSRTNTKAFPYASSGGNYACRPSTRGDKWGRAAVRPREPGPASVAGKVGGPAPSLPFRR